MAKTENPTSDNPVRRSTVQKLVKGMASAIQADWVAVEAPLELWMGGKLHTAIAVSEHSSV
jgi:formate dehydrogenase assembly factor FdhD